MDDIKKQIQNLFMKVVNSNIILLIVFTIVAVLFSELLVYLQLSIFWQNEPNHEMIYYIGFWTPLFDALIVVYLVILMRKFYEKDLEEKIEEAVEKSNKLNERLELALLGSNDGLWDWNLLDNSVYFSPRWKEMIGYSDDELSNKFSSWSERVHPSDIDKAWADIKKNHNAETEYYENIHRLRHKDGHWIWILDRGKTQYDDAGKAIRMIGTHTDISKEKEMQLKSAQQAQMIEQTHDSVISTDLEGNILTWNYGSKLIFEYEADEVIGKHISILHHKEDLADFRKNLEILISTGGYKSDINLVTKFKKSVSIALSLSLLRDEHGKPTHMVGYAQDITKRKEIEQDLAEQYALMQNIVNTVPSRIFWKDKNLIYLGANKLFLEDTGLERLEDIIGKSDFDLPWEETEAEAYRADDMKVMQSGIGNVNYEELQTHDDGSVTTVLTSKVPLRDTDDNVIGILGSYADITAQRKIEEELKEQKDVLAHQAHHDALTGLPNRILFNDRLKQAIEKAKRHNTKVALLFIDLDHFKEINDSLGHETGDEILKEVAQSLEDTIRDEDTLARLGGDEFTVIVEDLLQGQDASLLANKILKVLAKPINIEDNVLYVSSSIGISLYPDDGGSSANLLKYADSAMYKAKDEGRNNFQFYSAEMTELAFERVVMETSLREALEHEDFVVYYQPQIDASEHKVIGMEALVRWKHSSMGLVSPAKFIPIAESTGLIVEIDRFVMKTAMDQMAKWYAQGLNPGVLAMNLSIKQIQRKDFISVFENLIKETGCKSEWLELEVTEGQIMNNPEESIKILNKISDLGIELAVDDFGTGYSSLSYLKKLPINKLKIDQAFVRDLPDDEEDAAIAKAVIALAKSLNLRIIAEGVETLEQRDFLVENGCKNIQGYFYAKPMPNDEMNEFLLKGLTS